MIASIVFGFTVEYPKIAPPHLSSLEESVSKIEMCNPFVNYLIP